MQIKEDIEIRINESGLKELNEKIIDAFEDIVELDLEASKDLCPVKTGALRDSLEIKGIDKQTGEAYIGSDLDYLKYVALGYATSKGTIVPPNEFLINALESIGARIQGE